MKDKEKIFEEWRDSLDVDDLEEYLDTMKAYIDFAEHYKSLTIPDVVGQSEQLKAEVFTLANKLAISGEGDAAVAMHRIHNRL